MMSSSVKVQGTNVETVKVPFIQYVGDAEHGVAGFLDRETGVFDVKADIRDDRDIDKFLTDYDLSAVTIRRVS